MNGQRAPRVAAPSAPAGEMSERIYRLWDELVAFRAARAEAALTHLLKTVAGLLDAQNAYWCATVKLSNDARDPFLGWRPRHFRYLRPPRNDATFTRRKMKALQRGEPDETAVAHARRAGVFRVALVRELVAGEWTRSQAYRDHLGRGFRDSLIVTAPVGAMTESYYGFMRTTRKPFGEAERAVAYQALRGLGWFHRQVLLAHGVVAAGEPLSPVERRVLALLLTEQSEKQIAAALGVTPASAHTYARGVMKKLGVSGRSGLTALWLGQAV